MPPRKPAHESWESFVDRQIREAQERGEFDDLAGAGKPLKDLHRPHDELWWVRKKLKEENFSFLPPALQIRKDVETAREQISRAETEPQVRAIVTAINERIRTVNRTTVVGPPSTVTPLDEEEVVRSWREERSRAGRDD